MICYSLRDSIPCDKICKDIATYIDKHKDTVNENSILVINIVNTYSIESGSIPLLNHEQQK